MKICPKCQVGTKFYKNASRPDGLNYWCKQCVYDNDSAAHTKRERERRATPRGKALSIWGGICQRAQNRDGRHPAYKNVLNLIEQEAFILWAAPLIEQWWKEHPNEKMSINRINNDGHYSLDNIEIISLSENSRLQSKHKNVYAPSGLVWCGQCQTYLEPTSFYKSKSTLNGLSARCKKHTSAANVQSRLRKKAQAALKLK